MQVQERLIAIRFVIIIVFQIMVHSGKREQTIKPEKAKTYQFMLNGNPMPGCCDKMSNT